MLIPTRRLFLLLLAAPCIILVSGGTSAGVQLAWITFIAIGAAAVADGLRSARGSTLTFERRLPRQLYVDQPHQIEWLVQNRTPSTVTLQLRDAAPGKSLVEPRVQTVSIPERRRETVSYTLTPSVRGDVAFGDLDYRLLSPWGLMWTQRRQAASAPIRCLPHLANWTAADLTARAALVSQTGNRRYRWRGTGTVFESLRDYSSEDDIRWVDWKATARAQRPISRNFESERHQQVLLLIDSSRMMSTYCGHRTKFDTVIEAAILAAKSAIDQGDLVGMLVFSDKPEVYLHPRRERTQIGRIMDALYDREARLVEPDFESALTLVAQRNRRRSLMLLFTDVTVVESSRRMATYVRSLIPRHLPLVVTIADDALKRLETTLPKSASEFYEVGVANDLQSQRAQLLELLRTGGAAVLDSPADEVATRTIHTYLELKRRLRI